MGQRQSFIRASGRAARGQKALQISAAYESLDSVPGTRQHELSALNNSPTTEAAMERFLKTRSAKLEPEGSGWLLRYPTSTGDFERRFGLFEARVPIIGDTRKEALMIAELVLRGHEPIGIPAEPATERPPPAKSAARRRTDPTRSRDRRRPADMSAYQLAQVSSFDTPH
jgi:hypothetical protein